MLSILRVFQILRWERMKANPMDKKKEKISKNLSWYFVVIGEKMGNNVILEPINFV